MFSKTKLTTLSALLLLKEAQTIELAEADCGDNCGSGGNKADINLVFKVNVANLKEALANGTDPSSAFTAVTGDSAGTSGSSGSSGSTSGSGDSGSSTGSTTGTGGSTGGGSTTDGGSTDNGGSANGGSTGDNGSTTGGSTGGGAATMVQTACDNAPRAVEPADDINQMHLDKHNEYRAAHGAMPLGFSQSLADDA